MSTWRKLEDIPQVVVVADSMAIDSNVDMGAREDLEMTEPATLEAVLGALSDLGMRSTHVENPAELSASANQFTGSTVLSIYGGRRSRSRMALVPAICETHGLDFVGPDAYGRIICQDKQVSTRLAADAGFKVPRQRLFRTEDDAIRIDSIETPYVLKPLLEGSSIGITQRNLVTDCRVGRDLLVELLSKFDQPILLEEFVPGREVSLNFLQLPNELRWAFSEIEVPGIPNYFDTYLFDADEKLHHLTDRQVANINGEIPSGLVDRVSTLLTMTGTIGYGRVDGKLNDDEFVFLELTPDAWIAPSGAFAASFMLQGYAYKDVIAAVLTTSRAIPSGPVANG